MALFMNALYLGKPSIWFVCSLGFIIGPDRRQSAASNVGIVNGARSGRHLSVVEMVDERTKPGEHHPRAAWSYLYRLDKSRVRLDSHKGSMRTSF